MSIFKDLFGGSAGRDAGNTGNQNFDLYNDSTRKYLNRGANAGSQEFLGDSLMAGQNAEYGKQVGQLGDIFNRANAQEQNMSSRPYGLEDRDNTAFTQSAGNLARMFGASDNQMSQQLQNRGLSNSGSANRGMMTSLGSKNEQLGKLMTSIADQSWGRQQQQLNAQRDWLGQIQGQRAGVTGQQGNYQLAGIGQKNAQAAQQGQMGMQGLNDINAQNNENMSQRMATENSGLKGAIRRGALSQAQGMSGEYTGDVVKAAGKGGGAAAGAA